MEITKKFLVARKVALNEDRNKLIIAVTRIDGAILDVDAVISELERVEEVKKGVVEGDRHDSERTEEE